MTARRRISVTEEQWKRAADAFELGYKNTVEIAAELDVSRSTVSREFKRRGYQKGCRAMETVVELEAALDAKARQLAAQQEVREKAALERFAVLDKLMDELVRSLAAAAKAGNISAAAPKIKEIGKALRVR